MTGPHALTSRAEIIARLAAGRTVGSAVAGLAAELERWRATGRTARLWWRDDDAHSPNPELAALLSIPQGPPVLLAVIPGKTTPEFRPFIDQYPHAAICQHGWTHTNHAAPGALNSELGPERSAVIILAELGQGFERLRQEFGARFQPYLVPPWHQIDPTLLPHLAGLGFALISARSRGNGIDTVRGMPQVNIQVDLSDWSRQGAFIGEIAALDALLAQLHLRRAGRISVSDPIGILTHHRVLGPEGRQFLALLFDLLRSGPVEWLSAAQLAPLAIGEA